MNPQIEQKLRERSKINPYVNYLGIELLKIEDGLVEAVMPLTDEQKQYSGVSHGGVLAALADTIAGYAAYTKTPLEQDVLTAEMKISYLRAAWGKVLRAKGYSVKSGRKLHFCECEIYCDEKLVAKASGTFCVVEPQV
ncbi:MAG: PaaI family thioesterase [Tannerella sp.]|jgi:uncharacterized protein (TIGR00369 family)|nr:PaaI family thioesterase [Tannerella sp.]